MGLTMGTLGNGLKYVDRGDPADWDFTKEDFITDGQWHELDLSAIVPEGINVVYFTALIRDDIVGSLLQIRKKGNLYPYNKFMIRTQTAGMTIVGEGIVSCGADRKIEYQTTNTIFNTTLLQIRGWFKKSGGGII